MTAPDSFARLVAEQAASEHPWGARARQWGLLTVFAQLWESLLLAPSGEVFVDRGLPDAALSAATGDERETAHAQAARRHPELRHLMPRRPPGARTCPQCDGSGEIALPGGRRFFCGPPCNTKGWV
ncbi:hypothetical protein [Actinoplanes utahensis]|nr:hypothetical protein [Actinoplanes utahensis]GIF32208.1 hypothetical protein Aut01nite_51940 [Actinoplanes utahensis]